MASKKKTKKKKKKAKAGKSKAPRSAGKGVKLIVFVKPKGTFADDDDTHPGIRVDDLARRLVIAASKAKLTVRRYAPALEVAGKLRELLEKLYRKVAPGGTELTYLAQPSCWNEATKKWEPGACPAANAVLATAPYGVPGCGGTSWRLFVGLQLEGS